MGSIRKSQTVLPWIRLRRRTCTFVLLHVSLSVDSCAKIGLATMLKTFYDVHDVVMHGYVRDVAMHYVVVFYGIQKDFTSFRI